jgi:hypothetical protein
MTAKVHQVVAGSGMEWMVEAFPMGTGTAESPELGPAGVLLKPSRPNPFRLGEGTSISFRVPEGVGSSVSLEIFDVAGRRVRTLYEGRVAEGEIQTVHWNGVDDAGVDAAPGVYFYRLRTGSGPVRSLRTILLR